MLHARMCMEREMEKGVSSRQERQCRVEHCDIMKFILRHVATCENRGSCTMGPNCYYTYKLGVHWNNCNDRENCSLCGPVVREMSNEEREAAADRSSLGSTSGPSSRSSSDPVQLTLAHYGVSCNGCQTGPITNIRHWKYNNENDSIFYFPDINVLSVRIIAFAIHVMTQVVIRIMKSWRLIAQ